MVSQVSQAWIICLFAFLWQLPQHVLLCDAEFLEMTSTHHKEELSSKRSDERRSVWKIHWNASGMPYLATSQVPLVLLEPCLDIEFVLLSSSGRVTHLHAFSNSRTASSMLSHWGQ